MTIHNQGLIMVAGYDYRMEIPMGQGFFVRISKPEEATLSAFQFTLPPGSTILPSEEDNVRIHESVEGTFDIYAIDTDQSAPTTSLSFVIYTLPDALGGNVTFRALEPPTTTVLNEKFSLDTYDETWAVGGQDIDNLGSVSFEDADLDVVWSNVPYSYRQRFPADGPFGGLDAYGEDGYLKNISVYIGGMGEMSQDMATPFTEDDPRYGEHVPDVVYFGIQLTGRISGKSVYLALAHTNLPPGFTSGDIITGTDTVTKMIIVPEEATLVSLSEYNDFLGGGATNVYMTGPSGLDADGNFDPIVFHNTPSATVPVMLVVSKDAKVGGSIISADGISWESGDTSGVDSWGWTDVCWSPELGLFCAVAFNDDPEGIMTSPDGLTWTGRDIGANAGYFSAICWSPELGLFCAVGEGSGIHLILTSPDGINWTSRTHAVIARWKSVCWSPELGKFLAISPVFTYFGSWKKAQVIMSSDGINWTAYDAPAFFTAWVGVCWSPALMKFCAVARSGDFRALTSSDGINWAEIDIGEWEQWTHICWSPELGLFCAITSRELYPVMTSPDGINWTLSGPPYQHQEWGDVSWCPTPGLFCVTAHNALMTSPDGLNWTLITTSEYWGCSCSQ